MSAILFLANISRCAVSTLCPTDADLIAAVRSRDGAFVQAVSEQAASESPGDVVLVHSERIHRIADVLCGEELPDETPTITCKFTVRYWSRDAYQVAKLRRKNDKWEIAEALMVMRDRRGR
jgi:hypothetical protein